MSMIPIATVSLSGVSSGSFTNIPQTFTHLQLRFSGKEANDGTSNWIGVTMTFNSDTATNYSGHFLYSAAPSGQPQGLGAASEVSSSNTYLAVPLRGNGDAVSFCSSICDILDYTNTNKYKTIKVLSGGVMNVTPNVMYFLSGNWRSTSAITRIDFSMAGNFATGSRVDLYGFTTSSATGA